MNEDKTKKENTGIKYTFTWVDTNYDIYYNEIFADSEKEAIIKFFQEVIRFNDYDLELVNYEIDIEE